MITIRCSTSYLNWYTCFSSNKSMWCILDIMLARSIWKSHVVSRTYTGACRYYRLPYIISYFIIIIDSDSNNENYETIYSTISKRGPFTGRDVEFNINKSLCIVCIVIIIARGGRFLSLKCAAVHECHSIVEIIEQLQHISLFCSDPV